MEKLGIIVVTVLMTLFVCCGVWQVLDIITGAKTIHPERESKFTTKVPYENVWKTYSCVYVQTIKER